MHAFPSNAREPKAGRRAPLLSASVRRGLKELPGAVDARALLESGDLLAAVQWCKAMAEWQESGHATRQREKAREYARRYRQRQKTED